MRPRQLEPNELERDILALIADENPLIKPHLMSLRVQSREYTGVGSYTNFLHEQTEAGPWDQALCLNAVVSLSNVINGLGAVLFCHEWKPKFLEIHTYGDELWDGVYEGYSFSTE
ncbi:MAG: hypothetical protein KF861_12085 [Planctomycetaceae bacterium]|nr:hypothetical protein [Planctomycetaceae bacterium]